MNVWGMPHRGVFAKIHSKIELLCLTIGEDWSNVGKQCANNKCGEPMHSKILTAGLLSLGLFASQGALAQSSNLTNSATVTSSCNMAVTQHLNFGSINGLDPDSFSGHAQGLVHIKCTAGSYQVYLGNGAAPISGTGKICVQRMKHPSRSSLLVYALNTDETYKTIYPNNVTTCPTSSMNAEVYKTATFTSSAREMDVPVYASIQKEYMLTNRYHVGQYSDTITVYIAF